MYPSVYNKKRSLNGSPLVEPLKRSRILRFLSVIYIICLRSGNVTTRDNTSIQSLNAPRVGNAPREEFV